MSKSNIRGIEEEIGNQVQLFIWRIPNKHHDTMMKLQKQFNDINIKHGALRVEVFQLTNTDTYDGCTNIFNTISANLDEEVWVELQSHRDLKQMDEVTSEVMKDESMREESPLVKQFIDLLSPGSGMIMGKFTRLRI
jgi:uncharacterized protein YbaA (DUF1428 family)